MKINFTILALLLSGVYTANSQTPIAAVDTSSTKAASSFTYLHNDTTYNWGVSPNDSVITLFGFIAGSNGYTHIDTLNGNVKLRRVNNAMDTGSFTLEWVEGKSNGANFSLYTPYQKSMDTFLTSDTYNKGTDNIFDNTSANSNDIERLDWIVTGGYSAAIPEQAGVAVFDKGDPGTHDPFCIAAITSLDANGDPLSYGKIVRVISSNYGEPGPSFSYRVVKGQYPNDLAYAGGNTQNIGGVYVSFRDLGIGADTTIYGYSLFANDLPVNATPADLLDYTNHTFFPINTSTAKGGLDLVAVTGFNIATSVVLPVSFLNFNAVDNNDNVKLVWSVENETPSQHYDVERSTDGSNFVKINDVKSAGNFADTYSVIDNVSAVSSDQLYYRIKQYEADGSFHYSKTVVVRRNSEGALVLIYPNPVQDNLYLNISSSVNDEAVMSIYNSAGSRVLELHESLSAGNNSFTIDKLNNLAKDIYQLSIRLTNSGRSITKQFLKN